MKHEDFCTVYKYLADRDILTRKLFDVNLRLYKSSKQYRGIVRDCAAYILWCAQTEKEGYKKPHGYSGANAGIPFNIIATPEEVMLNPKIIVASEEMVESLSNCGSLCLDNPIPIHRHTRITFTYYDLDLVLHQTTGRYLTIQHEIDHNNGVLIWDREIKEEE